jgi:hypothetical protein
LPTVALLLLRHGIPAGHEGQGEREANEAAGRNHHRPA